MRQPPRHRPERHPRSTAPPAEIIRLDDPALDHRPTRLDRLPDSFEAELVEAAERGQVRSIEGNEKHVGVFPVEGVGTSIVGRPRPLHAHRRAHPITPPTAKSR
jgi:hypothetical protein